PGYEDRRARKRRARSNVQPGFAGVGVRSGQRSVKQFRVARCATRFLISSFRTGFISRTAELETGNWFETLKLKDPQCVTKLQDGNWDVTPATAARCCGTW